MVERERLVHIVDEVPELDDVTSLTMVLVLDGFLDAGNAAARAAQHLVDLSDGPVVATFDVDQLHDYRARRPPMTFARDHYTGYDAPRLVTVNDLYSFDPNAKVSIEPFIDIIGRHFKQPKEGLGYDNSPTAHMWRTIMFPDRPL